MTTNIKNIKKELKTEATKILINIKKKTDGRTYAKLKNELVQIVQLPKLVAFVKTLENLRDLDTPSKITSKIIEEVKVPVIKNEKPKPTPVPVPVPELPQQYIIVKDDFNNSIPIAPFVTYVPAIRTEDDYIEAQFIVPSPYFSTTNNAKQILNNFLISNKNKNIQVVIYGVDKYIEQIDEDKYSPDYTYKFVYSIQSLTDVYKNITAENRKKIYGKLLHYFTTLIGSSDAPVTGVFRVVEDIQEQEFPHRLRDGTFNCVLDCIRTQKTKITPLDNKKLTELNTKYFSVGVSFENLIDIAKKMLINIDVMTKLNTLTYTTDKYLKDANRQTIKIQVENLNHATNFKELITKKDKTIVYVNEVNESYNNNESNLLMFKKNKDDTIKYYWDNQNIYKNLETKEYDLEKYYINSKIERMNHDFEKLNNLGANKLYKDSNIELFNFINNSVHHVDEFYYKNNIKITKKRSLLDKGLEFDEDEILDFADYNVNMGNYTAYDRNKHFVSYDKNEYYLKHGVPATGKFNFYKVSGTIDINVLLNKSGFVQITNIQIDNRAIAELKYFINGYVYPICMIDWMINNNIKFEIIAVAFNNWKQELIFTDEMKATKEFYTKFIGVMSIQNDTTSYNMKCSSIEEYKDLKFRCPEYIKSYDSSTQSTVIVENNNNFSNKSHISSYILSYAMIEILNKLVQIEYDDLIGVKVDCIIVKHPSSLFKLSKEYGDYKIEIKGTKNIYYDYTFNNEKSNDYLINDILTEHKLNYKKINLISGMAGSGKTTRFYKKFDNINETIKCVFAFPNNNLCSKFVNEESTIYASTYHKMFNIGCEDKEFKASKYINVILDEATMISEDDMNKIIDYATKHNINLFIVGDYNITNKKMYQMKPVNGESFLNIEFNDYYSINLTQNYRQGLDIDFTNFLIKVRGQTNTKILSDALCSESVSQTLCSESVSQTLCSKMFKTINYDEMINNYDNNDVILTPYKEGGAFFARTDIINDKILKRKGQEIVNCKMNRERKYDNKLYVNAENIMVSKSTYLENKNIFNLSFAQTSHLVQGLEFGVDSKIYVLNTRFFTDNQLYVILSRAKISNQIIFVNLPETK